MGARAVAGAVSTTRGQARVLAGGRCVGWQAGTGAGRARSWVRAGAVARVVSWLPRVSLALVYIGLIFNMQGVEYYLAPTVRRSDWYSGDEKIMSIQ